METREPGTSAATAGQPPQSAGGATSPPARPDAFTARQLRFEPQKATRWFDPRVLVAAGLHEGVTSVFGSFLDKRELQGTTPCEPDLRYAGRDELWLDYVADTGDGFAATATVACQVAKPELHPAGADGPLPRGEILVLGGDEVYPSPSSERYEQRLEGPWRAALPWTEPAPTEPRHPTVYAVPGNHDWYDGLTGFMRLFGQGRWIGGWKSHQTRSYFAVQLPHRWWLWGVDIQAESLIDQPQLTFFEDVVDHHTRPGDRLVLATAVPSWTQLESDPQACRNLAYLERTLLMPARLQLKLTVAGDLHHYSRYVNEGPDEEVGPTNKITSGGGGAFLHPTHTLPACAEIAVDPDVPDEVVEYRVVERYPSEGRSRLLSLAALTLPARNLTFVLVPGLVTVMFLWALQFGLRSLDRSGGGLAAASEQWGWTTLAGGLFSNSLSALMLLVLAAGLYGFAEPPPRLRHKWARRAAKVGLMLVHLAAQAATIVTVSLLAVTVAADLGGWVFALAASAVALVVGGVAGSLVLGAYLAAAVGLPGLRAHANEAFAASRVDGYKNFLRMHVDTSGALTVHALGIDRPVRRWRVVPRADSPEASWIAPKGSEPRVRLVDSVTIR
jgi:hypothetical protein